MKAPVAASRPAWVDALNASARNLGRGAAGLLSLDESALLDAACEATGLDDYGDPWFREPLGILLRALEDEAELTLLGRIFARTEIQRSLQNRLRVEATFTARPEIADVPVVAPIFITGLGRSGTTLLHELMACDPHSRVPMQWETMYSVPPPESATYDRDPRIEAVRREIALMDAADPAFSAMHELAADQPTECIYLFGHQFASDMFLGEFFVPSYALWLAGCDKRPIYQYHRRMLQLLQHRHRGQRWVLKAPSHLSALPDLFEVYPDARVVMTHRDPLRVVGSLASLFATLQRMRSDRPLFERTAEMMSLGFASMLDRVSEQRSESVVPEDRFLDVLYSGLVANPVATVRKLYERWQLPLSPQFEAAMERYLSRRDHGGRATHRYDFADTGLDRESERKRYEAYMQRYRVTTEV